MSNIEKAPEGQAAADTPLPSANLTPEQVVEQLRALVAQIPEAPALTPQERELVRRGGYLPIIEVQAAVNVVGSSDIIAQAVGQPVEGVRQLVVDMNRWDSVGNELKGAYGRIHDANLVRKQRATLIAIQAYGVAQQLARNPENAEILPHVAEMKRLKGLRRRRKSATTTETPAPEVPTTPKA
jgi:hypothetical protein